MGADELARRRPASWLPVLAWCCLCLALIAPPANGLDLNEPPPPEADDEWQLETSTQDALTQETQPIQSSQSLAQRLFKRARDAVPSYFNFENFSKRFKRHYSSSEAFLRKSIFMSKIVDIFRGRVEFRMGRLGYKQEVNKFSDRSRSEFQLMFQPAPPPDPNTASADEMAAYQARLREHKRRLKEADRVYLMDINTESSLGELAATDEERTKRRLDEHVARMRQEFAREMNSRELEALMEAAVRDELGELGFETMTKSALTDLDTSAARVELPWPGRLKSSEAEHATASSSGPAAATYEPPTLAPHQALDWSRHACFHEVYDQGEACGRCYVYASTALAEFYGCTELGPGQPIRRRKFSKDFVMDCAQKFSPNVMGCAGGSIYDTLRFIAHAGANNIRSWRTTRATSVQALVAELAGAQPDPLDMRCPLDSNQLPVREWGDTKVTMNPKSVHPNEWLEALDDGPLVVSVQMPPVGVDSYAGGVHDGRDCERSGLWHAMLLVGYGVGERGEPYWRFRNSFGPDWGDKGHFNLAMAIPGACLRESMRVYREPCDSCGA